MQGAVLLLLVVLLNGSVNYQLQSKADLSVKNDWNIKKIEAYCLKALL